MCGLRTDAVSEAEPRSAGRHIVRDDGFHVDVEELSSHALHVETVAGHLDQSRSAVTVVRMDRMAYGLLCQVIPAVLDIVQETLDEAVQDNAAALHRTADDLRVTARHYADAEGLSSRLFHRTAQSDGTPAPRA